MGSHAQGINDSILLQGKDLLLEVIQKDKDMGTS